MCKVFVSSSSKVLTLVLQLNTGIMGLGTETEALHLLGHPHSEKNRVIVLADTFIFSPFFSNGCFFCNDTYQCRRSQSSPLILAFASVNLMVIDRACL